MSGQGQESPHSVVMTYLRTHRESLRFSEFSPRGQLLEWLSMLKGISSAKRSCVPGHPVLIYKCNCPRNCSSFDTEPAESPSATPSTAPISPPRTRKVGGKGRQLAASDLKRNQIHVSLCFESKFGTFLFVILNRRV